MTSHGLTILGSKGGPAIRPGGPSPTSSLLQIGGRTIVVDCGLGVSRGLVEAGVSLKALDLIFITHLHSDHVLELGPLIHTAWTTGLDHEIRVFGPPGTAHYWSRFAQAMEFDIDIRIADEGGRISAIWCASRSSAREALWRTATSPCPRCASTIRR